MKAKKALIAVLVAVLACGLLCLAGCGSSKQKLIDKSKLQVALNNGYAGFEELKDDGTYYGYDIEIANMIADALEVELVIQDMEFDSVIPAVKAGTKADLGISGITITDERKKDIAFTDAYYADNQSISVAEGSPYNKDNYKEGLNKEGITIYCQLGTSGEAYAKENFPNATIKGIADISAMFAALSTGQCDAVVQNTAPSKNIVANFSNLSIIDTVATGEEYGIAVNKDNKELLEQVNKLVQGWAKDGTLQKLAEKYNV